MLAPGRRWEQQEATLFGVAPESVLEPGREVNQKWRRGLPTIVASEPSSWNMGKVARGVHEEAYGPLWLVEAERAMGMPDGVTAFTVDGDAVEDKDRWRLVGNSYCVPVVEHLVMCALEAKGLITRNDVRQTGVIFTVNQDGPLD